MCKQIGICEGCREEITVLSFPHIERVWPGTHRQYWHTSCFVYAYPPAMFDPPPVSSQEFVGEGIIKMIVNKEENKMTNFDKAMQTSLLEWYAEEPKEWKPTLYENNKPYFFIRKFRDIGLDNNQIMNVLNAIGKVDVEHKPFLYVTNAQDINVSNDKFIKVVGALKEICLMCYDGPRNCHCMSR